MEKLLRLFLIVGVIGVCLTSAQQPASAKQVKATLFTRNLDPNEVPTGLNGTGPVRVNVTLKIKNFLHADPKANSLKIQMLVKMRWIDRRLVYTPFPPDTAPDNVTFDSSALEKIWVPTLYYVNSLSKETDKDNQLIRIFVRTGEVEYTTLVTLTTSCPMRLTYFPHDLQTCPVQLSSYGHTKSRIVFDWNKNGASVFPGSMLPLPDYELEEYRTKRCDAVTDTGMYSCLQLELDLQRGGCFYLVMVYIPLTMLIKISWLSYFMHPIKSGIPRLLVSLSALSLAVVGTAGFNMLAPMRNYTKAIDVFTGISLTLIFASLIEFIVVSYLNHYPCPHANRCKKEMPQDADGVDNAEQQTPLNPGGEGKSEMCQDSETPTDDGHGCGAKLDVIFRFAIPILYLVFVILYCLIYVLF